MKAKRPIHPLTGTQTWWLLAAGMAAFAPLTLQVPLWLSGLAALVFAWRVFLAWQHQPLPPRWTLILISLAGATGIFIEYRTLFGQRSGIALLVLFIALKQLEAYAARDGLAILLLAYFMTLAQFFDNQSIPIALTMIATLIVTTAALASLADAHAEPARLLRLSGTLLLQALPFMLILFILFPRISGPLWGLPVDAYNGLTGLSENMSPGAINNLIQSDAIAFRVEFDGPVPPRHQMYWRGPVLSRLVWRTWYPGRSIKLTGLPVTADPSSPIFRYTITLEPHNKHWLFALDLPVSLPDKAMSTQDFQIHSRLPVIERIRYHMTSRPEIGRTTETPDVLSEALQLPQNLNPRTLDLGMRIHNEVPTDALRLQRAVEFMRKQELIYTLQPPLMSLDVADDFLFEHKRGFCEHFSAAFVILMRAAGVPARVVTGYQGAELNPMDDTWVIRQSDAHAWTEVWINERGWVRVDPTAISMPSRIEQNLAAAVPAGEPLPLLSRPEFAWLHDLRYRWWAVNNTWNQWVLGYNPQRQREFLNLLGMRSPDWRSMTAVLAILCGGVLLMLTGWMLWRRPQFDPAERHWRRLSRRLGKHGLARQPWEGPQDYAHRVGLAQPAIAAEINRIATLYAGLRYGNLPPQLITELRHRIAALPS